MGVISEGRNTDLGRKLIFLFRDGTIPGPTADMRLSIDLTSDRQELRAGRIGEFLSRGRMSRGELDSLSGRLSLPQTSTIGRIWWATTHPLYRRLYSDYYRTELSDNDRVALECSVGPLGAARPKIVCPRRNTPQKLVLTEAATTSMIVAVAVLDRRLSGRIHAFTGDPCGRRTGGYSEKQTGFAVWN